MLWHKWVNEIGVFHFIQEEECLKREMVILRLTDSKRSYRNFLLCERILEQIRRKREKMMEQLLA